MSIDDDIYDLISHAEDVSAAAEDNSVWRMVDRITDHIANIEREQMSMEGKLEQTERAILKYIQAGDTS